MLSPETKKMLENALKQDIGKGDITSKITPEKKCTALIKAGENCTLAGIEEAVYLLKKNKVNAISRKKDGSRIRKSETILRLEGSNKKILSLERVCLNIIGRMSGIATLCTKAKEKMKNTKTTLAVTRKTVPGFQLLDKKAAETTGIWGHRKNLTEMVLLKENHLIFFENISKAVAKAKRTGKKVEVETEKMDEALEATRAKPDTIMLDNFSPKLAKKTIQKIRENGFNGKIELSGGITTKNLHNYKSLGADYVSMGELTKNARMIDFSLEISK